MWHIGFPETLWFTRDTAYQLVGGISAYLTEMMMATSLLRVLKHPNPHRKPRHRADSRTWSFLIIGFLIESFVRTDL